MKKIFFSLLTLCFLFSSNVQAQVDQGYIKMEITDVTSSDPQAAPFLEMLKGAQTEVFFADKKQKTKMEIMGGMVKMESLLNEEGGTVEILSEIMGKKSYVSTTSKDMEDGDQKDAMEGMEITYDDKDTKEILGYKCIKGRILDPTTKKAVVEMYLSKEIKANSKMIKGMEYFDLDGYPLEVVLIQPQMSFTLTTIELKEKVDLEVFNLNTDGYTKMTLKEFMDSVGGMGF